MYWLIVLVEEKEHIGDFKDYKPEGAPAEAAGSSPKGAGERQDAQYQ